ncbi:MAG: hybrid sensor histidine kinase/response regulator [Thermodesulfobacteriota bacterium]
MAEPDNLRRQLLATFQVEMEDHLQSMEADLIALEQEDSEEKRGETLVSLFRAAHSLKGAARAVDLRVIEIISHGMEDALSALGSGETSFGPALFDILFSTTDALREAMANQVSGKPMPASAIDKVLGNLTAVRNPKAALITGAPSDPAPKKKAPAKVEVEAEDFDDDSDTWDFGDTSLPDELPAAPRPASPQAEAPQPPAPPPGGSRPAAPQAPAAPAEPPVPSVSAPGTRAPAAADASSRPGQAVKAQAAPEGRLVTGEATGETVRVRTAKVDALMAHVGELVAARMRAERGLADFSRVAGVVGRWQKDAEASRSLLARLKKASVPPELCDQVAALVSGNEKRAKDLLRHVEDMAGRWKRDIGRLTLLTDDLQEGVRRVRMLPVGTVFSVFGRMVRDVARELGKDVALKAEGTDTEMDRQVLDAVKDPLMHLIRNAVDHGIEPPEEREACRKPRQGSIVLRAVQQGSAVQIVVADDGRGINADRLREAAVARGVLSAEKAQALTHEQALELIFHSGLSTRQEVTDLSGRGVGLDVVRENVKRLQGAVQVETEPGEGTLFTLTLPLTLASTQVLLVGVGGQTLAIPTIGVIRILRIAEDEIGSLESSPAVTLDNGPVPLFRLAQVLELPDSPIAREKDGRLAAVLLSAGDRKAAYIVDEFLGVLEVVVKGLGRQLKRVRNVAGATILGDGRVVVILSVSDLLRPGRASRPVRSLPSPEPEAFREKGVVLLGEGSLAGRTILRNLLENEGHRVLAATDGAEALKLLRHNRPDVAVIACDLPGLNGFALTRLIRQEAEISRTPVVLLFSGQSEHDRLEGLAAGADAHVDRSDMDPRGFCSLIGRYLAR